MSPNLGAKHIICWNFNKTIALNYTGTHEDRYCVISIKNRNISTEEHIFFTNVFSFPLWPVNSLCQNGNEKPEEQAAEPAK